LEQTFIADSEGYSSLYKACIALALVTYMGMGGMVLHSIAGVSVVAIGTRIDRQIAGRELALSIAQYKKQLHATAEGLYRTESGVDSSSLPA
jgi:hypothetical protein